MTKKQCSPADIEIIRNLFLSAAEQMRRTLVRTAVNAVIYEVLDFGISIADRSKRMISTSAGEHCFWLISSSEWSKDPTDRRPQLVFRELRLSMYFL